MINYTYILCVAVRRKSPWMTLMAIGGRGLEVAMEEVVVTMVMTAIQMTGEEEGSEVTGAEVMTMTGSGATGVIGEEVAMAITGEEATGVTGGGAPVGLIGTKIMS